MTDEEKVYDAVEAASNTGKIKRGVNEATKAVEREKAKIVVIAKDVSPEAITMHLPVLCEEKKIPYVHVSSRKELGQASGIGVPVSALAITEEGDSKKILEQLKKTQVVKEAPKEEPKKEEKPVEKEEKPAEAPKPEEKKEEKPAEKKEAPKEEKVEAPPKKEEKPVEKAPKKEEKPKEPGKKPKKKPEKKHKAKTGKKE